MKPSAAGKAEDRLGHHATRRLNPRQGSLKVNCFQDHQRRARNRLPAAINAAVDPGIRERLILRPGIHKAQPNACAKKPMLAEIFRLENST